MFKAQVLRRSFSLWNRVPTSRIIRSAQQDGHETIHIQRVRIRKPFVSRRRLLNFALWTAATYSLLRWLEDVDEDEEEEEEAVGHQKRRQRPPPPIVEGAEPGDGQEGDWEEQGEDDEDEDNDVLFFLPTGFSRQGPRTFYKGSDPEWQEFKRIAKDKDRAMRIRAELISKCREVAANHPLLKRGLGKVDVKKGRVWIELFFPDSPPPEFYTPGIELTEDLEFRKATRPVDLVTLIRLRNLMFPAPVAYSLYADGKTRVNRTWQDFRTYIGWESATAKKQDMLKTIMGSPTAQVPGAAPTPTTPPGTDAKTPANSETQQPTGQSSSPQKDPATPTVQNADLQRFLPPLPPAGSMTLNLSTFHRTFRKHYKGIPQDIPRGALIVKGLIEVVGERGKINMDVKAIYDPKVGKYTAMEVKTRDFREHRQHPKGGP